MSAGPASLLHDPPEETRRARTKPWVSPWSLDDEWDDEVPPPPGNLRVVAAERRKTETKAPVAIRQPFAVPPSQIQIDAGGDEAVVAKAGKMAGDSAADAPAAVASVQQPSPPPSAVVPSPPPRAPLESSPAVVSKAVAERNRDRRSRKVREAVPSQPGVSWAGPIIASLGLLGLTFLAWVYWQDDQFTTDEDLRLNLPLDSAVTVSAPKRMRSFLDSVRASPGTAVLGTSPWEWETPILSELVVSQGPAFDNLRDLLEDFDWHPRHSSWHITDLGSDPAWGQAALLLQAQAAYLVRRGDEESAFTTAIDMAEFSRRLQDLWAWPSFAARSQEMHKACAETMAELLKRTRLDSARLAPFQKEFAECLPSRAVLQEALSAYYLHEKKLLLGRDSGEPLETMPYRLAERRHGRLLFKINQTMNLFGRVFRELKAEVSAPPHAAFSSAADRIHRTRQTAPQFYQPNAAGERYFANRIDFYMDLPERMTLSEARHNLVLYLFAIRRYLSDHQGLPQGLSGLKPRYLPVLPLDPFAGEPPRYDPLRGRLYSVGTNRADEGGIVTKPPLDEPREPTLELGIETAAVVR